MAQTNSNILWFSISRGKAETRGARDASGCELDWMEPRETAIVLRILYSVATHTRDAFQVNKASKQFENNFYRFHEPIIQYSTVLRHQQQIAKVISKMRHNRNIPEHLFNKMPAEGGKYLDFL